MLTIARSCLRLSLLRTFLAGGGSAGNTLLTRIRGEYMEMPGLRPSLAQAKRLCGVERGPCTRVLDALVAERFLCVKANGMYARLTDGDVSRPRPAQAGLGAGRRIATAS